MRTIEIAQHDSSLKTNNYTNHYTLLFLNISGSGKFHFGGSLDILFAVALCIGSEILNLKPK